MNVPIETEANVGKGASRGGEEGSASLPRPLQPGEVRPLLIDRVLAFWYAEFLSPKDLVRRAIVIAVVFALARVFGLKEFTSILNGTTGSVGLGWGVSAFL